MHLTRFFCVIQNMIRFHCITSRRWFFCGIAMKHVCRENIVASQFFFRELFKKHRKSSSGYQTSIIIDRLVNGFYHETGSQHRWLSQLSIVGQVKSTINHTETVCREESGFFSETRVSRFSRNFFLLSSLTVTTVRLLVLLGHYWYYYWYSSYFRSSTS